MTFTVHVLLAAALFVSATPSLAQPAAIHADVETTYHFRDGRQITVTGRYYRSADGKVREDSGSGSLITDIRARTMTMLNSERKQALVLQMPEATQRAERATAEPIPFEPGDHEGRAVEKTRRTAADGTNQEVWFARDLGAVVYSRIEVTGLTTIRTLRNLKAEEPPTIVFEIPAEYVVTRQALPPEPKEAPPARAPKRTPNG
jgi:hypothetical protein